jgi:putative ABC transport system permease protein
MELEDKMMQYTKDHFGTDRFEEWSSQGNFWEFFLQPLTDIHLKSDLNGEFEANGDIKNVYIFSVIGFFVLIIACINFMNLSTARAARRAREVGIRKVSGSSRGLLVGQFLFESVLLTVFSVILAILLVRLVLPWFNDWLDLDLGFGLFSSWPVILLILGGGILTGIIAGIYPAFFLSSYRPVKVLKSQTLPSKGGFSVRNALVTFQFAASIFLIIGTLMVNRQMRFLRNTDLGFDKENVLVITSQPEFTEKFDSFRQEMLGSTMINDVTGTNGLPGYSFSNIGFRSQYVEQSFTLNIFVADESLDDVLGLEMAEGRFFSREFPSDTAGVVINETAARVLGFEDPIGKTLSDNVTTDRLYTIIGVVKDFNYESMHSEVRPMGIFNIRGSFTRPMSFIAVKYDDGADAEVAALAGNLWKKMLPGAPFVFSYLDDDYQNLYHNEKQTSQVFAFLALLAIIVACLGLLGLAAFITQQKTRQIAVRKVFGASEGQIVSLLSIRFIRWVVLSFIIAAPVGWWVMNSWLRNFVYKAGIAWWIFALAGIFALVIAMATISSVTLRAARMNAAEALKYE